MLDIAPGRMAFGMEIHFRLKDGDRQKFAVDVTKIAMKTVMKEGSPHPQLRHAAQVGEAQLLLIDVVVDVDGLLAHVPPQLLNHLPGHAVAAQVGGEPVSQAMRGEVVLQPVGALIVQAKARLPQAPFAIRTSTLSTKA